MHIGIIGLGLIGGSIARALKQRMADITITAFARKQETLHAALADKVIDIAADDLSLFAPCDVVFICVPVDRIIEYAAKLAHIVRSDCVLTDVGSVKAPIMRDAAALGVCFIGGHPMAGSEKSGYAASTDFLFENAHYILTPAEKTSACALSLLRSLAKTIGAISVVMDAEYHDQVVASVSHGPHVVAAALVNAVAALDAQRGDMQALAAGGFKDITRIASSDSALWQSICAENRDEVLRFMKAFQAQTDALITALSGNDNAHMRDLFASAKGYRDSFAAAARSKYTDSFVLHMDVLDRPGSIATVATLLSANNINIKNIGIVHNREYHDGVLQILLDGEDSRLRAAALLKEMNFTVYE